MVGPPFDLCDQMAVFYYNLSYRFDNNFGGVPCQKIIEIYWLVY